MEHHSAPATAAHAGWKNPAFHSLDSGELRLHHFRSRVFRNTRMVRVWLPPDYHQAENSKRHYPVFYLNDGQNLFDPATAFLGVDWQVGQTTDRLYYEGRIPPIIIVGIDNAQKDRIKEYLPYPSLHPPILRPRGKRYPDFLLNEIMPFIAKEYRVATGPENTGIGGSSLGAIISLFTAIQCPGVFGRLLLESPSLFISNRRLLNRSRTIRVWPARVFMAIGTRETGNERRDERFVGYVRRLEHILRRAGLQQDRLAVTLDEGAVHSEGEWAKRFPQALEFLYGKSHPH